MALQGLAHGPLEGDTLHVCVDMQRLFGPGGPWAVPWMERVLPAIEELADRHRDRTVFTRFIPASAPGKGPGTWARYYQRWAHLTLSEIDPTYLDLMPSIARFAPPALVLDKRVYSPWTEGRLDALVQQTGTGAMVITGGETDVCVLATVLGCIDRGIRIVLVEDALCSSSDATHDALMTLYRSRFGEHVEIATTQQVLDGWR